MDTTGFKDIEKPSEKVDKQKLLSSELGYPLPSNQEYLSYYVFQDEWRPTKPKYPVEATSASPGPATVSLPSTIGPERHDPTRPKAPSYKMGQKLPKKEITTGVGPGAYNINQNCKVTNSGKESIRAPKIGKSKRFQDKEDVRSPGPAAYNRDDCDKIVFPRGPSFSMPYSGRSKKRIPMGPAPNAYSLPTGIGPGKTPLVQGPSFSMAKSKRMPDVKVEENPGPAAYQLPSSNVTLSKSPGFYIGIKTAPPVGSSTSPGPGAYSQHLVKFDKYSTPRITFGIKHSPFKVLPGFAAVN